MQTKQLKQIIIVGITSALLITSNAYAAKTDRGSANRAQHERTERRNPARTPTANQRTPTTKRPTQAIPPRGHKAQPPINNAGKVKHQPVRFNKHHRDTVRDYYRSNPIKNSCPRGAYLATGSCITPTKAHHWKRGQPIPRGTAYHPIPSALYHRLGPPPVGYRYVNINGDILLIAITTGIIMDILFNY